ncbi:MAG TPA: hypothetical protein VMU95_39875 [Trebonia sp.]|nr:hypothetical protein [Trebonia sp.]
MRYTTIQEIRVLGPASCGPRLAPLMAALLDLEAADSSVMDPDLTADITSGVVDVELTVEATEPISALTKAAATLRAAIAAIGDGTPDWETATAAMHVAPSDTADSLLSAA